MSETPLESEEDFVQSIVDKFCENQSKVIEVTTGFRPSEPAHTSTGREWNLLEKMEPWSHVIPVESRPSNEDTYNFNSNATNNVAMSELSNDDGTQHEKDLLALLKMLKDKYPFQYETNKNILYDFEIKKFAKLYCITNFCPVLSCYDSIFWLKDPGK
ncbi:6561_t:CDS:2 [Funneliformis caledonium]|uniref:6561_t:CDS:1 n=1 Tax=Funneliformis caledonium TaxID=1117310 RepID=A0A9N9GY85_9GLOM|nr:6561_t:CDS:2 [Funneliformis caledonium]